VDDNTHLGLKSGGGSVVAAFAEVSTGSWRALAIAAVLLLILVVSRVAVVVRARRRRQEAIAVAHCRLLILEALVARARVSGQIDAATYQERMKDLVLSGRS
jgi:hypothetical protein